MSRTREGFSRGVACEGDGGGAGRGGGGAGEATEGAASVLRDEATPGAAGEAGGDTAREDSHVWCAR